MPAFLNYIKGLTQTNAGLGVLGLVCLGLYLLYTNRQAVISNVPILNRLGTASSTVPTRRQVLDNLDACYSYFESVGCKEGCEAIRTAVDHAFRTEATPVAPVTPVVAPVVPTV